MLCTFLWSKICCIQGLSYTGHNINIYICHFYLSTINILGGYISWHYLNGGLWRSMGLKMYGKLLYVIIPLAHVPHTHTHIRTKALHMTEYIVIPQHCRRLHDLNFIYILSLSSIRWKTNDIKVLGNENVT